MQPIAFINQVRRRLDNPQAQSPSSKKILETGIDEYRNATMKANNTGNAWAVREFTLVTIKDQRRYDILAADFSKALLVATVPSSLLGVVEPELSLEFTQLEQLPNDWAYLANTGLYWSLWWGNVSQKARFAAFYRTTAGANGFKNVMEIRPTPDAGEQYRVLYQVGDWTGDISDALTFTFPFPELDFYFITLAADGLLPISRWSTDEAADMRKGAALSVGYAKDLLRYQQTFDNFIASLTVTDMVFAESYADFVGV